MVSDAVYARVLSFFEFWPSKDVAIVALSLYLAASLAVLAMTVKTRAWYTAPPYDSTSCCYNARHSCLAGLCWSRLLIKPTCVEHILLLALVSPATHKMYTCLAAQDKLQLKDFWRTLLECHKRRH